MKTEKIKLTPVQKRILLQAFERARSGRVVVLDGRSHQAVKKLSELGLVTFTTHQGSSATRWVSTYSVAPTLAGVKLAAEMEARR